MKFDNVFSTEVDKNFVKIRAGQCDEDILKKEVILDEEVKDIKTISINASDYRAFISMLIAAGVELQKDYGVDLGFDI